MMKSRASLESNTMRSVRSVLSPRAANVTVVWCVAGSVPASATVAIDQALGPDHLAEHDLAGIVAAVGAVHGETPHAAGPQIHLVDRRGEAVRPVPVRQV